MSAARAYLSVPGRVYARKVWAGDALAEARRIVGEVEPHEAWRENSLGFPCYLKCRDANMEPWNIGAMLAEGLKRWLSLPSCAVCGAPFDHGCNIGVCSEACEDEANERGMA